MLEMETMEMETMIRWHHVCRLYVQSNDLSDFGASFTAKKRCLMATTSQAKSRLAIPNIVHDHKMTDAVEDIHANAAKGNTFCLSARLLSDVF